MASNQNLEFILTVAAQQGLKSLADVEAEIKKVTLAFKEAGNQADRMVQATRLQQLGGFKTAMMGATTAIQGTQTASANAAMALLNLNYVVRDSPYFFNNFAMGVLAVGNNLNPLIDSFNRLRKEALEKNLTTVGLLRQALVGGAGLSIAFSIVVTAIQAYVFSQASAKKATEETTKTIYDQVDALRKKTREDLYLLLAYERANLEALRRQRESLGAAPDIQKEGISGTGKTQEAAIKRLDDLIAKNYERQRVLESILYTLGDIENVENRLAINQQRLKDLNKDNLGLYKDVGKTYDEIDAKLKEWIVADEKLLGKHKDRTKEFNKWKDEIKNIKELLEEMLAVLLNKDLPKIIGDLFYQFRNLPVGGQNAKNPMNALRDQIKAELLPIFDQIADVATVAGNAISNAFLTGKNVIDAATQALVQFAVQLATIRVLSGFVGMFFGLPFSAGFLGQGVLEKTATPKGGMAKQNVVRVVGKITADKNNFIANIRNADNYYSRNEEFVVIGR